MGFMEGVSESLDSLKMRVEQTNFEDITPGLRARISCEMVKEALQNKKITPEDVSNFANSLIYEPVVPVTIGTKDVKIFPIELIVKARPLIIQQLREQSTQENVNFDESCMERSKKASQVLLKMEEDYQKAVNQTMSKFGPLAKYLSDEQVSEETQENLKTLNFARKAFSETQAVVDSDGVVERFVQTDLPNVYFGKDLLSFVESQSSNPQ